MSAGDGRARIVDAIDHGNADEVTRMARWTLATADPAYVSAWLRVARDPESGHREFSADELRAWRHAKSEARALGLADAAGVLVPFHLDPTIINTRNVGLSNLRNLARTEAISGNVWNGISSDGVTAGWYPEFNEVPERDPGFSDHSVTAHKGASWVTASYEALEDISGAQQVISAMLVEAANDLDEAAFVNGTGVNQPRGLLTALSAQELDTAGATVAPADLTAAVEALPNRYRPNASWLAPLTVLNVLRTVTLGANIATPSLAEGSPPTFQGRAVHENSYLGDTVGVVGDFRNFLIVERIGATVELVPHLFSANRSR